LSLHEISTPWNLTISLTKISAIDIAVYGCLSKMKIIFTQSIHSHHHCIKPSDLGRATIKSILISSHIDVGMGSGCNNSAEDKAWYLLL